MPITIGAGGFVFGTAIERGDDTLVGDRTNVSDDHFRGVTLTDAVVMILGTGGTNFVRNVETNNLVKSGSDTTADTLKFHAFDAAALRQLPAVCVDLRPETPRKVNGRCKNHLWTNGRRRNFGLSWTSGGLG